MVGGEPEEVTAVPEALTGMPREGGRFLDSLHVNGKDGVCDLGRLKWTQWTR